MRLKICTKPQNLNINQGKHCLREAFNHFSARWPHRFLCPSLAHILKRREQRVHEVVMSFSAMLEDAQMSVHSMMYHSHSNIKLFVFYTVINLQLNANT